MPGSFFNKLEADDMQLCQKKRLRHKCFPVNIMKFLRTTFLQKNLRKTASLFKLCSTDLVAIVVIIAWHTCCSCKGLLS